MGSVASAVGAGKTRRTRRFVGRDGRAVLVAIDMQLATGSGPALDVVETVAEGQPDGMLVTWQIARRYPEAFAECGLILRMDGAATHLDQNATGDGLSLMYRSEQAAMIGADAVILMVYPGMREEKRSLRRLAALVGECERIGMPVVAESIPGGWGQEVPWDTENIARSARICVEIGADAIKTMAPAQVDELGDVVEGCEAPLFVLGGPKRDNEHEVVRYAAGVVAAGASGICFGRNVWGASDPTTMVRRLGRAVHGTEEQA
jgi:class I fructose-bisphosphate aldolase/fructose-bisphosphate aldolase/2-amino-3,7-dideoxy-D-threo-hept-6-ulosonate synthase